MKYYSIINEYNYEEDYSYLNELLDKACNLLNVKGIFAIVFISNEQIHEMNLKYRKIDRPTDVLSFALNDSKDNFDEPLNVLGDIYISIPKMKEQSISYGHSEKRELSFLCIHGLLHLLGYDHQTKEDETIMFNLQKEVLKHANITK